MVTPTGLSIFPSLTYFSDQFFFLTSESSRLIKPGAQAPLFSFLPDHILVVPAVNYGIHLAAITAPE
jgi:hypothetical protein